MISPVATPVSKLMVALVQCPNPAPRTKKIPALTTILPPWKSRLRPSCSLAASRIRNSSARGSDTHASAAGVSARRLVELLFISHDFQRCDKQGYQSNQRGTATHIEIRSRGMGHQRCGDELADRERRIDCPPRVAPHAGVMGVAVQAFANETKTRLRIQVLQRRFPPDKSSRAFGSERRASGQGEREAQCAPSPTHSDEA